ncbi:UPF0182 family protein [Methylotuvimicrobium sp. KM1]|uniref:UPF0182 family protein n=1 Tax=Methylotuvimicrobium sp. KM1 TaxID=3377707 RepID=UPI00384EEA02
MRIPRHLTKIIAATLGILLVVYVAFYFVFLDLIVDYWWFQALRYEGYFWLRLLYRFFLSGAVTAVFFSIFFLHFWLAARYLGFNPNQDVLQDSTKRKRFESLADLFMSLSIKFSTPVALILAIAIAMPFYHQWEMGLLYFFGGSSGVVEPVYGQDIGFYLLSYPIYLLIQEELLATAVIILLMVAFQYWVQHTFIPSQAKEFPKAAKVHLAVLFGFVVLFVVWGFMLYRFSLLYVDRHEPVFSGPGFVEIRYQLPLIWLSILGFLAAAISLLFYYFSETTQTKVPFLISLVVFVSALGLQEVKFIPELIDKFIVKPNPVRTQRPFIDHNIVATLDAYDLKNIHIVDFTVTLDPTQDIEAWSTRRRFENIPVWDREFLSDVYNQIQSIRPYYHFLDVDEGRYFIDGFKRQVNLAAREMNISKLPKEAQNWENTHLRFTHGFGAVVTPAAQDAGQPIRWFLRDLNLSSNVGLDVKHPDIYYGMENYKYAIVPNKLDVVALSGTQPDPAIDAVYTGSGGIPIPSLFRKALFSFFFKDEKIFFSTNISRESRLLIRRNVVDRISHLAPFLHLDKDPYLVVTKNRFYWVQDAYTLSNWYPVSKSAEDDFLVGSKEFNYIRNSVKITVDAYSGLTRFYVTDPSDVIIQAYDRAYPGVFRDIDEMPTELKRQLRFPRDLFYLQMKVYAKYHQRDPALFYQQAETWNFAEVRDKEVRPYYQTVDLGHCGGKEEFVMINPMTPINNQNLSMVGVASVMDREKCGDAFKKSITVYQFAKEVQVNGPAQVEALIEQDPDISAQLTLWDQRGSRVRMGRMIILPMEHSILYVQPLYLIANKTSIPELARVIVSIGNEVVMDTTLWSAFSRLRERFIKVQDDDTGTTFDPDNDIPK